MPLVDFNAESQSNTPRANFNSVRRAETFRLFSYIGPIDAYFVNRIRVSLVATSTSTRFVPLR